jgi:hypothetical protein
MINKKRKQATTRISNSYGLPSVWTNQNKQNKSSKNINNHGPIPLDINSGGKASRQQFQMTRYSKRLNLLEEKKEKKRTYKHPINTIPGYQTLNTQTFTKKQKV